MSWVTRKNGLTIPKRACRITPRSAAKRCCRQSMERWLSWSKALDSKSSVAEMSPWVRIPLSPLKNKKSPSLTLRDFFYSCKRRKGGEFGEREMNKSGLLRDSVLSFARLPNEPMKSLLLSFLSPCGRIGNAGFWWRQLLVAVLLCPASAWLAHTLTWMKWGAWSDFAPVPFSFMQVSPLAYLPSVLAGSEAVNDVRLSDGWAPDTLAGVHLSPALLVGALLVCLLSWCSFALSAPLA